MHPAPRDEHLARSVCRLLGTWAPTPLLVIGDRAGAVVDACPGLPAGCDIERLPATGGSLLGALDGRGRYAAAVVSGLDSAGTGAVSVLARLRDYHAPRVCLIGPGGEAGCGTAPADLRALGFAPIPEVDATGSDSRVFVFDIDRYKATPDWLSPRDWAHPDRWDKERW